MCCSLTGMPTNAALFPQAVDDTTGPAITNFGNFAATGPLGACLVTSGPERI